MKLSLFQRVFPGNAQEAPARALYESVMLQSREVPFYTDCAVPDSVDGRFELLVLHCFLVMRRLRGEGEAAAQLSQTLFDILIFDLDQSIRESGVGDLRVGPRIKAMGQAFYGRLDAYGRALDAPEPERKATLEAALQRNLYGTLPAPPPPEVLSRMAHYLARESAALQAQPLSAFLAGSVVFGPPAGAAE